MPRLNRWRVRLAYWKQYAWFYAWKWTIPYPAIHRRTIRPANEARWHYQEQKGRP